MDEIKGQKYKLAGVSVYTKGTLVDVFATFAHLDEDIEQIMSERSQPRKPRKAATKEHPPGSAAAMLDKLEPLPRFATIPSLSTDDIVEAIVGKHDLRQNQHNELVLTDTRGVIADLGPEKLAQVLVEMGRVRAQVMAEGQHTFVPLKPKATP